MKNYLLILLINSPQFILLFIEKCVDFASYRKRGFSKNISACLMPHLIITAAGLLISPVLQVCLTALLLKSDISSIVLFLITFAAPGIIAMLTLPLLRTVERKQLGNSIPEEFVARNYRHDTITAAAVIISCAIINIAKNIVSFDYVDISDSGIATGNDIIRITAIFAIMLAASGIRIAMQKKSDSPDTFAADNKTGQ